MIWAYIEWLMRWFAHEGDPILRTLDGALDVVIACAWLF